jgi:hypothetical protein
MGRIGRQSGMRRASPHSGSCWVVSTTVPDSIRRPIIVVDNLAGSGNFVTPQQQAADFKPHPARPSSNRSSVSIKTNETERMVMKSQTMGLKVASVIFGLFCLVHILRLIRGFQIVVGSYYFGRGLSVVAIIVSGFLCVWLWKLACPGSSSTKATPASNP